MTNAKIIKNLYPGALLLTGFNDCIHGICERNSQDPIVAYDLNKILDKLTGRGMTRTEAVEYWEVNQIGEWMGEGAPCFINALL